jgi:putative ABC transport system permease protein
MQNAVPQIIVGLLFLAGLYCAIQMVRKKSPSLGIKIGFWALSPIVIPTGVVLFLAVTPILAIVLAVLMTRDRKLVFRTGFRNLLQAKRRTMLLGSALAFVTVLFVLLLSLLQGITDNMVKAATTLAAGHINVAAWFKLSPSDAAPVVLNADVVRKIAEENTPNVDYVISRQRGFGKLVSDTGSTMSGFTGIDPKQEGHLTASLTLARLNTYSDKAPNDESRPGDLSKVGQPGTVTIFASQAKKLGATVGDSITLTTQSVKGAANSAQVTIVAICEDIGMMTQWSTFVHESTIRDLYQLDPTSTGVIMIYLKDIKKSDETMVKLFDTFKAKGYELLDHDSNPFWMKIQTVQQDDWTGQRLDLTTWEDEVSFLVKTISALRTVGIFMMVVLIFVIVIGIINTMWIAVRERTQEIGTLRAVGMSQGRVLVMFLTEAVLLGIGSTVLGSGVGGLIGSSLNVANFKVPFDAFRMILLSDTFHFSFLPGQFLTAILVFTAVTAIAALWPSTRASRLQPVTAMQHVE